MTKIPVKLTRGEIVVPPQVYQQHKARIEEMNRQGLLARQNGGVVNYRANGGVTERFLGQDVPQGSIGKLGSAFVNIGQRDFKGASEALATTPAERKARQAATSEAEAIRNMGEMSKKAYNLVDVAGRAIVAHQKITAEWNDWYRLQAKIPYVNQGVEALKYSMDEGITQDFRQWIDKNPEEGKQFAVLQRIVTTLTTSALDALGPGPKTDFDFIVAGRTVADLSGRPSQIKATLADAVKVANQQLTKLGQPTIEFAETPDVPVDPATVKTESSTGESVALGGSEEEVTATSDSIEAGMTAKDSSGNIYTIVEVDGKAVARNSDYGDYELFWDGDKGVFFVLDTVGNQYPLTFFKEKEEVEEEAETRTRKFNKGGLIAWG